MRPVLVTLALVLSAAGCSKKRESNDLPEPAATPQTPKQLASAPPYPTPKSSGSEGIFTLEEPDRGPLVTELAMPSRAGMKVARYAYCELDYADLICHGEGGGWRVSRGARRVIAEKLDGGRAVETVVLDLADGAEFPRQIVKLDRNGEVEWSRHFNSNHQYSERQRSGANQLPGCGSIRLERSDTGQVTSATCLQWMGEPMRDRNGVVQTALKRDAHGFVVDKRFVTADGKDATRHDGVHRVVMVRDEAGRLIRESRHGRDDSPRRSMEDGCAGVERTYDSTGRVLASKCLGGVSTPMNGATGYHEARYAYDERGCLTRERYLGADGKPAASRFRGFGVDYETDEKCRTRTETCVDAKGARGACAVREHASIEIGRDAEGREISRKHFDAEGKPYKDPELSVFELRFRYDERGRKNSTACFDPRGMAIECPYTGYHRAAVKFDDAGREVSEIFFDPQGKPTDNVGTFEARSTYDNYDHIALVASVDRQGKPALALGASLRKYLYDDGHRLYAFLLYESADRPATYRGCFTGYKCPAKAWHAVRVEWSDTGELVKNYFYDAGKRPIAIVDCRQFRCFGSR